MSCPAFTGVYSGGTEPPDGWKHVYFCVPLCNPVDLCVARGLRLMYAYISLNLYQQKQISWFVEPPYSELLQELSGGIRGSPPERVVYTRNLLRVYIAVVPVLLEKLN